MEAACIAGVGQVDGRVLYLAATIAKRLGHRFNDLECLLRVGEVDEQNLGLILQHRRPLSCRNGFDGCIAHFIASPGRWGAVVSRAGDDGD